MQTKNQVRKALKQQRLELDQEYVTQASKSISQQLIKLAKDKQRIHSYQPITKNNEVDISEFNDWAAAQPGKTIHRQDLSDFPDQQFDLVIVPGIAFDQRGYRLGYGQGNYDRFLAQQRSAMKVGVCFSKLIQAELPTEAHDQATNLVVTDN